MNPISVKHCEVCLQKGIKKKVRTLCDECREFLCKECSDTHLLHKPSKHHNLLDLEPPGKEPTQVNEDDLASNFLEHVSGTSVPYRAQVVVERGSRGHGQRPNVETKKVKSKRIKAKKCIEISVGRQEDKKDTAVTGIIPLLDKVIVVDCQNYKLKVYDSSGDYLSSTELDQGTWGITLIHDDKFATCGEGGKIFQWRVSGQTVVSDDATYNVGHDAYGLHYNGIYYCVLPLEKNSITVLDRQGRKVRKIKKKKVLGKKIQFGLCIHIDPDTNNIYVPCEPENSGVLCMSIEGEVVWFTPLDGAFGGITEIHGYLCIADARNHCLHLISKKGKYKRKLLDKEDVVGTPYSVIYNEGEQKLYVGHWEKDILSIFRIHIEKKRSKSAA